MHINSALLTDQYQLVMAYSYWKLGVAERQAVFNLSFRKLPLQSSYILVAGLQRVIEFIRHFKFTEEDIAFLRQLQNGDGPLFTDDFLKYLKDLAITCDIEAIPEGTVVFAKEPIIRITGPILQCQLLETALLNFINFASLIATKASLVCLAAEGDPVIEFGLRRAQGPDGGLTASRSAYIGGCVGTSNVLAGKQFGLPTHGTMAHSWIMAFPTEIEAFENFAKTRASNTSLLVDTYDTLQGIEHAIRIGQALMLDGEKLEAIRLDSGNLLDLSRKARRLLDQAGLKDTKIMASGDLDEHIIRNLKSNDAPINSWGVGTRLVTSYDQPALNAIYKLTAIKTISGTWDYKIKISNDINKSTLPGILQVRRCYKGEVPIKDIIYDIEMEEDTLLAQDYDRCIQLLEPIFQKGTLIYLSPPLKEIRDKALKQVACFTELASKPYPVILDSKVKNTIENLIKLLRAKNGLREK